MQEFEKSKTINADADHVFTFLTDMNNLPKYLPTVRRAEREGDDRIRMEGEASGHKYNDTGYFRTDEQKRRMEWGSDNDSGYQGWLTVEETGTDRCEVSVQLSFSPKNHALQEMGKRAGDQDQAVNEGIENALLSIKDLCEGRGGKVESVTQK